MCVPYHEKSSRELVAGVKTSLELETILDEIQKSWEKWKGLHARAVAERGRGLMLFTRYPKNKMACSMDYFSSVALLAVFPVDFDSSLHCMFGVRVDDSQTDCNDAWMLENLASQF